MAVTERGGVDLAEASAGRFGPEPTGVLADIDGVQQWWAGASPRLDTGLSTSALAADLSRLGPPVPRPPQVFAIGLNYLAHATETGMAPPQQPMVFTKFPSCIVGPAATVPLVDGMCDWEVELVVVIGRGGRRIGTAEAMGAVAGFCVGQDISERVRQREGTSPQFSLAKSSEGFGPTGPWITTPDELDDPFDLEIGCSLDDEVVQRSRTSDMVFGVAELVAHLSAVCELRPGDLIFTGTPEGVGMGRRPPRSLHAGTTITSWIEGLGRIVNTCT